MNVSKMKEDDFYNAIDALPKEHEKAAYTVYIKDKKGKLMDTMCANRI